MSARVPASLAELGDGLDITYVADGKSFKLNLHGLVVGGAPDKKTIWIVPKPVGRSRKSLDSVKASAKLRKSWSALEPDEDVKKIKARDGKPERLGLVKAIGYRSDKWSGHKASYQHDYTVPPVLTRVGEMYRVSGGKQRITPAGITG